LFAIEWLLRVTAYQGSFFTMEGRWWNYLDTVLIAFQCMEQLLKLFSLVAPLNMGLLRMLRILRIIRVARVVRSLHLFDELRVITASVTSSAASLFWDSVLLTMTTYIASVIILQVILSAGDTPHRDDIAYWFPSLSRAFLTLFESIVGGVSWDEIVAPLVSDIGPLIGIAYCLYVAVSLFAMMNLLTGVFVDQAMRVVREDKDTVLAKRIADLFLTQGLDDNTEITWDDFNAKLQCDVMKDYFKQINVEVGEARALFEMIDIDQSGSVDCSEIVQGCLRLRGPARSLEMFQLLSAVNEIRRLLEVSAPYISR